MQEDQTISIQELFQKQTPSKAGFFQNPSYQHRIQNLKKLEVSLHQYEDKFLTALKQDLDKHSIEAYCTEILPLHKELQTCLRSLKKWMKPSSQRLPILLQPGNAQVHARPKGQVLIIGPFNYPVNLTIKPLIGALAAGNRVILKPSEHTQHVTEVLLSLIKNTFPAEEVAVVTGGKKAVTTLLDLPFDHFFFTGSQAVGQIVYQKAAQHMSSATLELGGKSPTIVWEDADIETAARKIVWGKFLNFGQTCVAPDYILAHAKIFEKLILAIKNQIKEQFSDKKNKPCCSIFYGKCISQTKQQQLLNSVESLHILTGGVICNDCKKLAPTLVTKVPKNHDLLTKEIFGPVLPILSIQTEDQLFDALSKNPYPLASYLYSRHKSLEKKLSNWHTGALVINDNVIHAGLPLPFGGIKTSGLGQYHGHESFKTFSEFCPVITNSSTWDASMRYSPYKFSMRVIKKSLPALFS
ncbi:MAG: aldehyde dehydrogenase family protein [Oligoflexales bacterium]